MLGRFFYGIVPLVESDIVVELSEFSIVVEFLQMSPVYAMIMM